MDIINDNEKVIFPEYRANQLKLCM